MKTSKIRLDIKRTIILGVVIIVTAFVSIQSYKNYISEPKLEIVNKFWADYSKIYEKALKATLTTHCSDDTILMIEKHVNEKTSKLVRDLKEDK